MKLTIVARILIFFIAYLSLITSCSKKTDTPASVPTVTTTAASAITTSGITTGGSVSSDGGATISARGICWATHSGPTAADTATLNGSGTGNFSATLAGLLPYTKYYIRAYATNSVGTGYGNEIAISTLPGLAAVETIGITLYNGIYTASGTVLSNGGSAVTAQGICWATHATPTINDFWGKQGVVSIFNIALINVEAKVTYHVRAFATNSLGTAYGKELTFSTPIALGLLYQGGVIFSIDNSGQHGLVAATSDIGTAVPWAPGNLFTTTTSATSTSDGSANTTAIINRYGDGTYAAKICHDYTGGGYSDWFLPAQDQLNDLLLVRDSVPGFPVPDLSQPIPIYWSSTEFDYFHAWDYQLLINTPIPSFTTDEKQLLYRVRPVRAF